MRLPGATVAFLAAAVHMVGALPMPQKNQNPAKDIQRDPVDRDSPPEGYGPEEYHKIDEKYICAKFDGFAKEADFLFNLVSVLECGDDICWEPVRKGLYELEYGLDVVDTDLDNSDRSHVWECPQEAVVSGCFHNYANVLIKALNLLRDRTRYIDYRTAKFINLALNSLRASDYVLVYELVRRMHCEEHQMAIMKKHGAIDGSTPGSLREAFAEFISTPLITGDDFKVYPGEGEANQDGDDTDASGGYPAVQGREEYPGYQGQPGHAGHRGNQAHPGRQRQSGTGGRPQYQPPRGG